MFVITCISLFTFTWQALFKAYSGGGTLQGGGGVPWGHTAQISLPENLQSRGNLAGSLQLLQVQICCGVHTKSMLCPGQPLQCKGRASLVAQW